MKALLLRDPEGWKLVSEGPSEGGTAGGEGEAAGAFLGRVLLPGVRGMRSQGHRPLDPLFRFSSVELARK